MVKQEILYVTLLSKHGTYVGSEELTLPTRRVIHEAKMLSSPFSHIGKDDPVPPKYILELHPRNEMSKGEEEKEMYYSIKFHCSDRWLFANDNGHVSLVDEQQYLAGCTFRTFMQNNRVVFQSANGMYLSAQKDRELLCDRTKAKDWEEFTLLLPHAEKIGFRSSSKWLVNLELGVTTFNGQFSSPYLAANKKTLNPWDTLTVKAPGAKGGISFRGCNGLFMCAERNGSVLVDRNHERRWECFHVILRPGGHISLLSIAHGTYIAVNPDGRVEAVSKSLRVPESELKVIYTDRGTPSRFIQSYPEQNGENLFNKIHQAKYKHNRTKFDWEKQYIEILIEIYDFTANLPERKQKQDYICSRIDSLMDSLAVLHKSQTLNVAEYRAELLTTVENLRQRLSSINFPPKEQELKSNHNNVMEAIEKLSSFLISH
eukprot:gb/GECH01013559.1/.p1 GENE.gb/GECH01013559.1/~~gb/GECH01013559.1/.p1  ORF type:complete len:430 (+),score=96.49 gb/GECH01013559.1/:1-1290(+)